MVEDKVGRGDVVVAVVERDGLWVADCDATDFGGGGSKVGLHVPVGLGGHVVDLVAPGLVGVVCKLDTLVATGGGNGRCGDGGGGSGGDSRGCGGGSNSGGRGGGRAGGRGDLQGASAGDDGRRVLGEDSGSGEVALVVVCSGGGDGGQGSSSAGYKRSDCGGGSDSSNGLAVSKVG